MARAKKASAISANSNDTMAALSVPDTQKHVALAHLYIIKDYIDKQADKTISSVDGFHGIRYYDGKLQAKDAATGNWVDVATGGADGGGNDIADNKDVEDLFGDV